MESWKSNLDLGHPCWEGYRELLERLPEGEFPDPAALSACLPEATKCQAGHPLRFVAAASIPDVPYEKHIYETGQVSTRANNWHDLFNAIVWCRLPRLKAAMNAMHYAHLDQAQDGRRGRQRDGLTLLDESGVIVHGGDAAVLEALSRRDWHAAFVDGAAGWRDALKVTVCGHAILEKFLTPYKAMTAQALFVHFEGTLTGSDLDKLLADALLAGELLTTPADLSPLPLMGIPGWWPEGRQDAGFYADRDVFRPPR